VAGGGEAEPMSMYYTQAYNWGDEYTGLPQTFALTGATIIRLQLLKWLPTNAAESSSTGNPDGSFMYSIWNQWQWSVPGDFTSGEINEDAIFRRLMFLDGE